MDLIDQDLWSPYVSPISRPERGFDPSQLITRPGARVRVETEEEYNTVTDDTPNGESSSEDPLQQLDWLGTATVTPLIEKGLLRPAADLEFPVIAYRLYGSPVYQSVHSPTALAPQFEKGILVPAAADWEFPIVAYYLNDFKRKNKKAEEGKSPEERKHPSKNCKRGMRQVTQRLIYLVGEPSGKCDYYVLYSKSKPSPPTTSLTLGGYSQDYHGYAEQDLKKQRKLGRSFDPSQLITPPGTKVRVQLKEGDDLPEINMISFGRQKLKPRRKKISQQELQDPSDKVDYHVPRPKESSAYLAAPVVTPAFLWPSTSEIGPTMQLLSDVTPGGLIDYSYVPPPESLEDSPPEDPDQKIHMMEIWRSRTMLICNKFPYETDHQAPWGYGLEVVTSTGVKIEPEVAEIGGMTRSGRCYTPEELESKRKKGKEKGSGRRGGKVSWTLEKAAS
ncbi:hypothetical protein Acr_00g0001420 [Actinidia rufa]|uniref:Uncharacterized protein n=1 Tax=Actinidia rufa TaxID=165716 RepID=A0A7J0D816_9ERIC|nr:hypothetical protein Acr_00g0001420 [Actinidia rufa]